MAYTCIPTVFFLLFLLWRPIYSKQCLGNDQCSCTFDTDSSVVDLTSLGNRDSTPRFKDVDSQDGNKYSYNPCYPFNEGGCQEAAVCALVDGQEVDIGSATSIPVIWSVDASTGNVVMVYAGGASTPITVTQVILVCDPHACTPQLTADGEKDLGTYQLTLATVCTCPNGCDAKGPKNCDSDSSSIGGGTIFIIIVFSLAIVYLLGGMLFMKFVKKASGTDVIPNKAFWVGLPSTLKRGVMCLLCPVMKKRQYDSV